MESINDMKRGLFISGLVAAFVGYTIAVAYGAREVGLSQGVDAYHQQCYQVGGYVINEKGEVVVCKGLTTLPKQETEKYAGKQI